MNEKEFPEYREGYNASNKPASQNPYPWTNQEWWRHEAWEKGRKAAQDDDDDYGGGTGSAGWPSTTGNPSGGGRRNG